MVRARWVLRRRDEGVHQRVDQIQRGFPVVALQGQSHPVADITPQIDQGAAKILARQVKPDQTP